MIYAGFPSFFGLGGHVPTFWLLSTCQPTLLGKIPRGCKSSRPLQSDTRSLSTPPKAGIGGAPDANCAMTSQICYSHGFLSRLMIAVMSALLVDTARGLLKTTQAELEYFEPGIQAATKTLSLSLSLSLLCLCMYAYTRICIYIYICLHVCIHTPPQLF